MKAWDLDEIRRGVKGKWAMRGEISRPFNGRICTDSRKAVVGDLFFAIKGEKFDAHEFVKDVIGREVAALVVHRELPVEVLTRARDKGVAVILVDDTIAALNRLAGAYRANELGGGFRAKVIAVGGSNGKTTTKRILHALLEEKFGMAKGGGGGTASPKSFNNNIGMPLTLLEVMPGHDYVVLEIGTNAPGEIAALAAVCRPDVAVITSIGLEHLEKLGDLAGVAREEAAVAGYIPANGTLIVADVPELMRELAMVKVQKVVVGMTNDEGRRMNPIAMSNDQMSKLTLTGVRETVEGAEFSINGRGSFFVPLLGEHNAMNALMAVAVARRLGVSDEQIAAGLKKVTAAEGRFEPVAMEGSRGGLAVINDAYNANPSSVAASLRTFARLEGIGDRGKGKGRRVVVLGDMLELGAASDEMHREVGRQVAAHGFEVFVAIGKQMGLAAETASAENAKRKMPHAIEAGRRSEPGAQKVVRFESTAAAREGIGKVVRRGDRVLLKGSHGMALETLLDTLRRKMVHDQ
jgi:UDP-N-acetylmuramoyl-tripeptide--D-alanyl-D-alanine ligase